MWRILWAGGMATKRTGFAWLGVLAIAAFAAAGCGAAGHADQKARVQVAKAGEGLAPPASCAIAGPMVSAVAGVGPGQWRVLWIEAGPSYGCVLQIDRLQQGEWKTVSTLETKSPVRFSSIVFLGASDGWLMATTGRGYPSSTSIYRTENGGTSWSKLVSSAQWKTMAWSMQGLFGYRIAFANSLDGWILASALPGVGSAPKELLGTTDGGRHWAEVADSAALLGPIGSDLPDLMAFTTPEVGWIAASTDTVSTKATAYLFRTGDGGRTWTPVALPVPSTAARQWIAFLAGQLTFASPADGLLVYRFVPASGPAATFCYRTRDGGGQWSVAPCTL